MSEKKCNSCEEIKNILEFYKDKSKKDGLSSRCKKCIEKYNLYYRRTKDGVVSEIYGGQKKHSKDRGHRPPGYTKEELKDWIYSQAIFHELYSEWVNSDFKKRLKPSVDRKDDYIHYCFTNIQLLSWGENESKGHSDRKSGKNNKQNSSVKQFTKDGEFIAIYHSMSEASRQAEVNLSRISLCCKGKVPHAGGYVWKDSDNNDAK